MDQVQSQTPVARIYRVWEGGEVFLCAGRTVTGKSWRQAVGTGLLIIIPYTIFLVFVAWNVCSWALFLLSAPAAIVVVGLLYATATTEPGVYPRLEPDDDARQGRKPRMKDITLRSGERCRVKYCDTCHIYRPPRTHHCSVNDSCIERFDHHCPWTGTTIGRRNYRLFALFLISTTLLDLWVFAVSATQILEAYDDNEEQDSTARRLWKALGAHPPAAVLVTFTFICLWFVGGLTSFHLYLIATNQTTYENFLNRGSSRGMYDRGMRRNCYEMWCRPVPRSRVDFRQFIGEGPPPTQPELDDGPPRMFISSRGSSSGRGQARPANGSQQPYSSMRRHSTDLEMAANPAYHIQAGTQLPVDDEDSLDCRPLK